ncbi:MAG: hypothetical protein HC902_04905 [Calothrix sp. SM1_5_4]|nr:hypothetical protein [Calothrix sp. SM1_5_4]
MHLPVLYRSISWKLRAGSALDPDRDSSLSVGLMGSFALFFSNRSSLQLAISQQHMWTATLWHLGWQYEI